MKQFYNVQTKPVQDFPDELQLTRRIVQTVRGLQLAKPHVSLDLQFVAPVDHEGTYLTAEQTLLRLRKLVGASTQVHIKEPRMFLHEVKDSNSIGLATLYSRYVRSLMANCLHRLNPSHDYVTLIQRGEYNCLVFANAIDTDEDSVTLEVTALLCPHVEPDWALDDFCRREIQLYQHDLYGDRGRPSLEEFLIQDELLSLSDAELAEYAYQRGVYRSSFAWAHMTREQVHITLYEIEWRNGIRGNMSQQDRLEILPHRINQNLVSRQEAFYWFRFIGRNHPTALQDSKREIYRSLLLTDVREYLEDAP